MKWLYARFGMCCVKKTLLLKRVFKKEKEQVRAPVCIPHYYFMSISSWKLSSKQTRVSSSTVYINKKNVYAIKFNNKLPIRHSFPVFIDTLNLKFAASME